MATLFESATSGGLFIDAATAAPCGGDLDFEYFLSQVGVLGSPSIDDSFFGLTAADRSSAENGELKWHVEWFNSANDIVDLASCDLSTGSNSEDQLKPSLPPATNDGSTDQNIKQQTTSTAPIPSTTLQLKSKARKRLHT